MVFYLNRASFVHSSKGSLMRIYRDIRFSKDKSPDRTYAAARFWQANGKDGAAPAYFLHRIDKSTDQELVFSKQRPRRTEMQQATEMQLEPGNSENEPEPSARQRPVAFQDLLGLHNIEHSFCEET